MKLKYKKMVILVTMSTMFIGLVIFGIVSPSNKSDESNESKKVEEQKKDNKEQKDEAQATPKATVTPEVTVTPEPTKEPETVLKKDSNKNIIKLVKDYFKLGLKCDIEGLKKIHTEPSMIKENEIKAKYKYVDDIKNIESYIMDGPEKGTYLIYIYSEFKFKDIKTLAPGLSRLYLIKTKDGDLKIFNGADAKINEYIIKADKEEEVQALVDKVSTKLDEALSSDADLKKFNEDVLNKNTNSENKNSDSKKDTKSDTKEETKKDTKSDSKDKTKKAAKSDSKEETKNKKS